MRKYLVATASAVALALSAAAGAANAALLVDFGSWGPALTFSDGTFSHHLSGVQPDGFYALSQYAAFNGFGQNGQHIDFNAPVTLGQLTLGACADCYNSHPATFTANLYDAGLTLLASQSVNGSSTEETLVFNTANVSRVEFTFDGADGTNPYPDDTREVAWYVVRDISYKLGVGGVPEPATWALMIGGFGMAGGMLRRRRAMAA